MTIWLTYYLAHLYLLIHINRIWSTSLTWGWRTPHPISRCRVFWSNGFLHSDIFPNVKLLVICGYWLQRSTLHIFPVALSSFLLKKVVYHFQKVEVINFQNIPDTVTGGSVLILLVQQLICDCALHVHSLCTYDYYYLVYLIIFKQLKLDFIYRLCILFQNKLL